MKLLLSIAVAVISLQQTLSATEILRRPLESDYELVVENADRIYKSCERYFTASPLGNRDRVVVFGSGASPLQKGDSEIYSLELGGVFLSKPFDQAKMDNTYGFAAKSIRPDHLADTDNAEVRTGNILKEMVDRKRVGESSTIVVKRGSGVDTSLLIRFAEGRQFIIEQRSEPSVFARNMRHLRDRPFSTDLAIFDFSPRTEVTRRKMGATGRIKVWQKVSAHVNECLQSYGKVTAGRSKKDLLERMVNPDGSIVVIYGHSDGQKIWLDTSEGIESLSAAEIESVSRGALRRLTPMILLNCDAKPLLADAFLSAGSPCVVASDKMLSIDQIAAFIERLSRNVFGKNMDTLDAFYDAQRVANPYRLHPMASRSRPLDCFEVAKLGTDQYIVFYQ